MLVNGLINGILVPVEVADEELVNNGYHKVEEFSSEENGARAIKEVFLEKLINKMDITDIQSERLMDSSGWNDYYNGLLMLDDEEFADRVLSGDLLNEMTTTATELIPAEKYFEVEVELSRMVRQCQTITVAIKAEDEADARSIMYNLDYSDFEDYTNEYDWEEYGAEYDDHEIDDWYVNGETDIVETGYPVINE